jgi:hypothetical protein
MINSQLRNDLLSSSVLLPSRTRSKVKSAWLTATHLFYVSTLCMEEVYYSYLKSVTNLSHRCSAVLRSRTVFQVLRALDCSSELQIVGASASQQSSRIQSPAVGYCSRILLILCSRWDVECMIYNSSVAATVIEKIIAQIQKLGYSLRINRYISSLKLY